jgi:hypothetical protein
MIFEASGNDSRAAGYDALRQFDPGPVRRQGTA